MPRKRGRYSRELREEAVRQMRGGAVIADLSRDLAVPVTTLHFWRKRHGIAGVSAERQAIPRDDLEREVKQLRREVTELRAREDFLKKAIAFFARASESDTP